MYDNLKQLLFDVLKDGNDERDQMSVLSALPGFLELLFVVKQNGTKLLSDFKLLLKSYKDFIAYKQEKRKPTTDAELEESEADIQMKEMMQG